MSNGSKNIRWTRLAAAALGGVALIGCAGRSIDEDNPVFAAAPPRRSLQNAATMAAAPANNSDDAAATIRPVAYFSEHPRELTGSTVVAEVNGDPILLDDILKAARVQIQADPSVPDEYKHMAVLSELKRRLPAYVEQQIVLTAMESRVDEERRQLVAESLEPEFQKILEKIKKDNKIQSPEELNAFLGQQGMTVEDLRHAFLRVQMQNGFLMTMVDVDRNVDRAEMLQYYRDHIADYTATEKVRWQEIVVVFDEHGGRGGAEEVMAEIVRALQSGESFSRLAQDRSDAFSASQSGDLGWLERNSLKDQALEEQIYALPVGGMTQVFVRDDRFELYRKAEHQRPEVTAFADVQDEIEQAILEKKMADGRAKTLDELRNKSTIVTIFDDAEATDDAGETGVLRL